jgi:hypothetical protein
VSPEGVKRAGGDKECCFEAKAAFLSRMYNLVATCVLIDGSNLNDL